MTVPICWRLHLSSPPERVYELIATGEGRKQFWAESAPEIDGHVIFEFPNGIEHRGKILSALPPSHFSVVYFGQSQTSFDLEPDGKGGTDLTLTDEEVPEEWWQETHAGWISVLFALKAAADYGIDLRNHDPKRNWDHGFVDN